MRVVVAGVFRRARKLWGVAKVPAYWPALRYGVAASCEHRAIPYQHDFATILDVGANRGQFAVFAEDRFPRATLLSFEPLGKAREQLKRVIRNPESFRVYDVALGDRPGKAELRLAHDDDMSSLLDPTRAQLAAYPASRPLRRVPVRIARLDDELGDRVLEPPVLLKIDVQGSELDVLRGAQGRLGEIESIVVESSFVELFSGGALAGDVAAFLHTQGFRLASISSPTFGEAGRCLQAELLFERDESVSRQVPLASVTPLRAPVRAPTRLRRSR